MSSPVHRFLSTASLISRIPIRLRTEPDFSGTDFWMPIVGLGAGACACGGAILGSALFGPGLLAALTAMAAQYLPFNLFHLDGLLDTADAMGVQGDAEERRAVLKDPRVGSFALFTGFMTLSARLAATSSIMHSGSPLTWGAFLLAPIAGRFAALVVTGASEPHAGGGLASLLGRPSLVKAVIGYAIAAIPAAILFGASGGPLGSAASILVGGLAALVSGLPIGRWYARRMGGYSGDALGAAVELGELLVLLIAATVCR
jgi:adenosylcobinamide-GDP ribazoletransferase